ncbi:hypothetical protein FGG78_16925 [Thioclava sp. BHET1]|uniref:Lipoprotein n=1 Tax=Thioclava dalianensis TaxID=1185766 RepID=A0A074TNN6_9RHOB|nr:hypothetical protein [Thioclava dalianensis]KEP70623.1 hypothetical protein DL1_16070 [Thioclava dalianensis]TMV88380.1 hypothetical protein FGG78_16925 [Thioclava sp. BHET1]SFN06340.1 hypothetical protein SAMN05216224_102216 [Thioclava dalianensis]
MKKALIAALALTLATAGCSAIRGSKLNPFTWFSPSRGEPSVTLAPRGGYPTKVGKVGQIPAQVVSSLTVEKIPSGAIITAMALPPTQGFWDTDLVPLNGGKPDDAGTLTYRFMLHPPSADSADARRVSTPQSRAVSAAAFVNNYNLQNVRTIVVQGATTSRSARR